MSVAKFIAVAAAGLLASGAGAASYSAFDAFQVSGTGIAPSAFSYGWTSVGNTGVAFNGTITALDRFFATGCYSDANVGCALKDGVDSLGVYKALVNGGSYDVAGTGRFDTGELNLHPGNSNQAAAIQFTAQEAGQHSVTVGLSVNDERTDLHMVDYYLYAGTTLVTTGVLANGSALTLADLRTVGAGDRFTLLIGSAGNYGYDSTGVSFRVESTPAAVGDVPEPATWGTMILGFGLAGAVMRRRRTAALA